jgi:hypothetical protein
MEDAKNIAQNISLKEIEGKKINFLRKIKINFK